VILSPDVTQLYETRSAKLQDRLLNELDSLFEEIEDGIVKDNAFVGCIALGQRDLPPLNERQSAQLRELLLTEPAVDARSEQHEETEHGGVAAIGFVLNLFHRLWHPKDTHHHSDHSTAKEDQPFALLLDPDGRVKEMEINPAPGEKKDQTPGREISEADVKRLIKAHGKDYAWVLPYCWDIANRLGTVKGQEREGDVALFLEKRRKLNVRRPNATRFEQSLQRYAVMISELYCDEEGAVRDKKALEAFIRQLVTFLLNKTKVYWATTPLLAIFDAVVATVIRPLLFKHRTAHIPHQTTTDSGLIVVGNMLGKAEQLITEPNWNADSLTLVQHYVEKALKTHLTFFFFDQFGPYNREYAKFPHFDPTDLPNVGLPVKEFNKLVHLKQVVELIQPTAQADELIQYVEKHFRSDEFIGH